MGKDNNQINISDCKTSIGRLNAHSGHYDVLVLSKDKIFSSKIRDLPLIRSIFITNIKFFIEITEFIDNYYFGIIIVDVASVHDGLEIPNVLRQKSCHMPLIACVSGDSENEEQLYDSGFNAVIKNTDSITRISVVISNFISFSKCSTNKTGKEWEA